MSIRLSDFELPGNPGVEGDVTYTSLNLDLHSLLHINERRTDIYLVTGYRREAEGYNSGVLIKGTQYAGVNDNRMREIKIFRAPEDENFEIADTEFYWAEAISDFIVRICGCYTIKSEPELRKGFLYEGPLDGSGNWYPISIPDSEETVVRACLYGVLFAEPLDGSDELYALCLKTNQWHKFHLGFVTPWEVVNVTEVDGLYTLNGEFDNGKSFTISYKSDAD